MPDRDDAILTELGKLNTAVGRLEGATEALAESIRTINRTQARFNRRLNVVEKAIDRGMGWLGAIGGFGRIALVLCGGAVGSLIVMVVGGHP